MKNTLDKKEIERFSRQIILKNIGYLGQKKIKQAKSLKQKLGLGIHQDYVSTLFDKLREEQLFSRYGL